MGKRNKPSKPMSDLEILNAMDRKKQNAWAGFFNGGRSTMSVFEGREQHLFFGKYECEQVPASFWTEELPALGWIKVEDSEKRPALGMDDLPEGRKPWCWTRTFCLTDRGWDVREADLADFKATMTKRAKEPTK